MLIRTAYGGPANRVARRSRAKREGRRGTGQPDRDDRVVAEAVVSSTTLGQAKQSSAAMATAGW
jgi:hypothetical protein